MDNEKMQTVPIAPVTFDEFDVPTYQEWKDVVVPTLKGAPFEKKMFTGNYEGITYEPIYTADHLSSLKDCHSFPGEQDYLRGTKSASGLHNWEIAQGVDARIPEKAGKIMAEELAKGATVIHPVLDADSVHGRNLPETSGRGVSISSIEDVRKLFAEVDITAHPLHIATGESALPVLSLIAAYAAEKNIAPGRLSGCVGADPLAALAHDGSLTRTLDELYDECAAVISWCEKNNCHLRTILLRGSVYASAGASAVQETACVLASAVEIIRAMGERGIAADVTCRHIQIETALGANFFMEIARLRASRVLWAHVAKAFGCEGEAVKANVFAVTSPFTYTVYDPYVNILRSSTQAFSAAIAGVDGMQIKCFDDAIRPATEQARRIARNQQIMLQTEFNLDAPVDPAGGSWCIETLTRQVEDAVWELFTGIEGEGGFSACLENGSVQSAISLILEKRFANLATRRDRAVGNNMYANITEKLLEKPECMRTKFVEECKAALSELKKTRSDTSALLEKITEARSTHSSTLVENSISAFASDATLEEICGALAVGCQGDIHVTAMPAHRWTEQYEALRKRTEDYMASHDGDNVRIFLANMGPIPQHKPRADFSTGFLEVAHFEVLKNNGFATPQEAADAAVASGADAAVICSTDATYPEDVPPLAKAIKAARPEMTVFLAGRPAPDMKQTYIDAGVDDFIHVRANCLQILSDMQKKKGMC